MTAAPAFVDFESRSRADLKKIGGRRYAEHPSTEVICAVLRYPDGCYQEIAAGDTLAISDAGPIVCAHNAINFDRHIWRKLGWPEPERWIDTAELAKVAGYPSAKLEWLAENLLAVEKDMAGNALTLSLSKPEHYYADDLSTYVDSAKAEWRATHPKGCGIRLPTAQLKAAVVADFDALHKAPAPIPAETLARVVAYCRTDVEIMAALFDDFLGQWLDSDLPGLEAADRALNDRGICFDVELARILIDADAELGAAALERAGVPAGVVGSPAQLRGALAALGVDVADCQADTLTAAWHGAPEAAQRLIEARQACSSIASGKLQAGLARVSGDGRLRDNRVYIGAHTGRWSGRGMQLDNLAKGD